MTIGILIPCHNEEKNIRETLASCLRQTRKPDKIVVVDDASTDRSVEIIREFGNAVTLVELKVNRGNKSYVQEEGLQRIDTDVFVATDGDTLLHEKFLEEIEKDFAYPDTVAVCGYVKSLRYNWLTACRELEYVLSQNLYKKAQAFVKFVYVIPGCAGAFRTEVFKRTITFDHDTVTEDLDFTYKLHEMGYKVRFNWHAWVYTQDPVTLHAYANQMRRWYGGGWQNLMKHWRMARVPVRGMELAFMYIDSLVASLLLFAIPFIDIVFFARYLFFYVLMAAVFGAYAAWKDRRPELFLKSPLYVVIMMVNAWIFLEEFVKEVVFRKRSLQWYQPPRVEMPQTAP
jgi:cellulose synthase/poly-beta-1,6-N-acetylglucosamine synthase-like glycosyltransferase